MKIQTKHLFKILSIVKKTGVLNQLKDLYSNQDVKGKSAEEIAQLQESVGMDIMISVVGGLEHAEDEIYDLLSDLEGKKVKEIQEQDPSMTIASIKEIISNEAFQGFLISATK